jgi:cytochrome c oxidase subunit 2
MPLAFHIVSPERYAEWLKDAKAKYASNGASPARVADAGSLAP